jgi:hypothetical protein
MGSLQDGINGYCNANRVGTTKQMSGSYLALGGGAEPVGLRVLSL